MFSRFWEDLQILGSTACSPYPRIQDSHAVKKSNVQGCGGLKEPEIGKGADSLPWIQTMVLHRDQDYKRSAAV